MPAYVPPHLRKQQQQQEQEQQHPGAAASGSSRSLAELDQAAAASESARWGRAAALGGGGGSSRRWDSSSSNNRSREDRSYEYRNDSGAPCVHPADDQEGVGICFGTVVRREASEHPVLSKQEVAKIAAAAAADALTATGDEEHDGEKGSEEPFFDAFLTAAVPTEGTDLFALLAKQKQRLARQDERVWQMRDTPRISFIGQFYSCMREVDRACDGYFSAPPRALSPPAPAKSAALAQNRFALDPAGSVPARAGHTVEHFLDIGCAPGGFAQFLLDHSPRWQGIGLTLEEGGHLMDERFMADARRSVTSGGIAERFRLIYGDVTESPAHMRFLPDGTRMPVGSDAPPQFDLVIAGARSSKSEGSKGTYSRAAVKILLSAQLLVCLDNLKPGGTLVVVVNITPHLTHLGTLCFLRGIFRRVVATKPVSCFKYRSSCYVTCFGYSPDSAAPAPPAGQPEPEPAAEGPAAGGGDDVMGESSRAGMAEIKRRILYTLKALSAIDADSAQVEHGWRDSGPAEREVLAPVCDVDAAELLRLHYHAMGSLLTPLWQLQCDVITELLQRAERTGIGLVE